MSRRARIAYVLCLLVGCGVSSSPPVRSAPSTRVATSGAPVVNAAVSDVAGQWSGPEWGRVVLTRDGTGTYTDTYGTGPGRIEFRAAGDGYDGRWVESERRFGTLHFALARDGRVITGTWAPDPECTIGTRSGGTLEWTRSE